MCVWSLIFYNVIAVKFCDLTFIPTEEEQWDTPVGGGASVTFSDLWITITMEAVAWLWDAGEKHL